MLLKIFIKFLKTMYILLIMLYNYYNKNQTQKGEIYYE